MLEELEIDVDELDDRIEVIERSMREIKNASADPVLRMNTIQYLDQKAKVSQLIKKYKSHAFADKPLFTKIKERENKLLALVKTFEENLTNKQSTILDEALGASSGSTSAAKHKKLDSAAEEGPKNFQDSTKLENDISKLQEMALQLARQGREETSLGDEKGSGKEGEEESKLNTSMGERILIN